MYTRRLLINTVHNMRELGGYATADGRVTGWRRFIRSDAPLEMTEACVKFLYDYGVRTVIDLRQAEEARWKPTPLSGADGFIHHNISFTDDFSIIGDALYCPRDHLVPLMQSEHRAAEILRAMAHAKGAVLFYCSMGKDRTGVVAALLLMLAGVPRADVMADYQVTYTYIQSKAKNERDAGHVRFMDMSGQRRGERPEYLRRTEPEWLLPFMEFIESFGGAAGYLRSIGLTENEASLLRQKLLA